MQLREAVAHDHPERQERLLGPDVLGRQPRSAAPVARAGAAIAQGQPRPGRDRHDGADRHRPGRSRSGPARGSGDPRRGRDLAGRRRAARARLRRTLRRRLERAARADRAGAVHAGGGRPAAPRCQRARRPHRPGQATQAARSQRRHHPLPAQPAPAGRHRVGRLLRHGIGGNRSSAAPGFPGEVIDSRDQSLLRRPARRVRRPSSRRGPSRCSSAIPMGHSTPGVNLARARLQDQQALRQLDARRNCGRDPDPRVRPPGDRPTASASTRRGRRGRWPRSGSRPRRRSSRPA